MKINHLFDADGWLQITLTPETVQESAQLARFGLNADAPSRKVSSVYAFHDSIRESVTLRTLPQSKSTGHISRKPF